MKWLLLKSGEYNPWLNEFTAYLRQFRCKRCGFRKDIFLCENFPSGRICCSYGTFEEDTAASIYISSQVKCDAPLIQFFNVDCFLEAWQISWTDRVHLQEVLLGPVPTVSEESLPFPQLIVIVLQDDLSGQVQIGDSIAVIGHAFTEITQTSSAHERCIGQLKVKANNIAKLGLFRYNSMD